MWSCTSRKFWKTSHFSPRPASIQASYGPQRFAHTYITTTPVVRSTALMTSSREQFGRPQDLNFADLDKTPVGCWTHLPHELANLRWILACQPTISGSSSTCCESAWSAIFFLPLFSFRSASYQTKVTKYCQKDIDLSLSSATRIFCSRCTENEDEKRKKCPPHEEGDFNRIFVHGVWLTLSYVKNQDNESYYHTAKI